MSFGAGYGNEPIRPDGLLASEADREAAQAVLKQAFEDQRLTQDEFEARVGQALAARTQGQLAALTRDLPRPSGGMAPTARRPRRTRLVAWIAAAAVAVIGIVLAFTLSSGPSQPTSASPAEAPQGSVPRDSAPKDSAPGPGGPAKCPVGTAPIAVTLANALASDPVYVEPGSSLLTPAQAQRLRSEIGRADPGRIRMAAVKPATVRKGGGERALANAIASCQADAAGVSLVTTADSTYLVTSYPDDKAASQAAGAALNTHASLAAGLIDAAKRLAAVDPGHG
jgi:hypothetical protein